MKTYYLKITALTPLHIGTGEDYEPTNFVIDEGKLYEFDESAFYARLDTRQKAAFNAVVANPTPDMLFQVHAFVKRHKEKAIEAAHNVVPVTEGIAKDYDAKIGKIVQHEGKGRGSDTRKVFNQFQIARAQRLPNFQELYIPGSSFKGALATGWQEWLFKHDRSRWEKEFKNLKNPTFSPMKNLLVADCVPLTWRGEIGYALNKERFEDDEQGPKNKLEVIREGATFVTTIGFKSLNPALRADLDELVEASNAHYGKILKTITEGLDHIHEYVDPNVLKSLANIDLGGSKFLMRVGKHSGARSVTIEGLRSIRVKESGGGPKRKPNEWKNLPEETTTWLYGETESQTMGLIPFGWVLCEIIEQKEHDALVADRENRIDAVMKKRRQEMEAKKREEAERLRLEVEKAAQKAAEEARRKAEAEAEAARLASLSPVDRLLEEHDTNELIRMMQNGEIEDYKNIKIELARKIKAVLQQDPKKWDKAKQKALKRKEFIQSILGE